MGGGGVGGGGMGGGAWAAGHGRRLHRAQLATLALEQARHGQRAPPLSETQVETERLSQQLRRSASRRAAGGDVEGAARGAEGEARADKERARDQAAWEWGRVAPRPRLRVHDGASAATRAPPAAGGAHERSERRGLSAEGSNRGVSAGLSAMRTVRSPLYLLGKGRCEPAPLSTTPTSPHPPSPTLARTGAGMGKMLVNMDTKANQAFDRVGGIVGRLSGSR